MFERIKSFFRKTPKTVPSKPSWDETVDLMYEESPSGFSDEIIGVFYSRDKENRLIVLKSPNGYFYYKTERLIPFDDGEWSYIAGFKDALPAFWSPSDDGAARSVFGTEQDLLNEVRTTADYKLYFTDEL